MIAFLRSLFAAFEQPRKPMDLTGACDGYCNHWQGVAQVTPDFTNLKQLERN